MRESSHQGQFPFLACIGIIAMLSTVLHLAVAAFPLGTFNADEASYGIMARDMLQGVHFPIFAYGREAYAASLPSLLAVPWLALLGENSISALRINSALLYGLFLFLNGVFVRRIWGARAAVFSALFLCVPPIELFIFTSRIPHAVPFFLCLCMMAYLLLFSKKPLGLPRLFAIGVLAGLCLWIIPSSLVFFLAAIPGFLLQSEEWRKIRKAPVSHPVAYDYAFVSAFYVMLFVILHAIWEGRQGPLIVCIAIGVVVLFLVSTRKARVLQTICSLLGGLVAGGSPILFARVVQGIVPHSGYLPKPPDLQRFVAFLTKLLPAFVGADPLLMQSPHSRVFPLSLLFLLFVLVGMACWRERRTLRDLLCLRPLTEAQKPFALLIGLAFLPLIAMVGIPTIEPGMLRYVVGTWYAAAIMAGIGCSLCFTRVRAPLLVLCLVLWIMVASFNARQNILMAWSDPLPTGAMERLGNALSQEGITIGYADYWLSTNATFLANGKYSLASYTTERVEEAASLAANADEFAVVLSLYFYGALPHDGPRKEDLLELLRQRQSPAATIKRISEADLLRRVEAEEWDIWIFKTWKHLTEK